MQKYSVNQQLIETVLAWVNAGEIMEMELSNYQEFLAMRRKMMAGKIKGYYFTL
jgi:hypothetical protein